MIFSSPYHHNTNGVIERQFRTIRDYINASLREGVKKSWAELIPDIEYVLNATAQKTTGVSPAEIIFGRKINRSQWHSNNEVDRNEIMRKLEAKRQQAKEIGTTRNLEVGDKVLVKQEIRNKDHERYEGPYTVIKRNHERSYLLTDENGRKITRNIEKLKHFKEGGM